jgi:Cytochrome c oxidase caa3 assembly factor (Caa3_CtaG)
MRSAMLTGRAAAYWPVMDGNASDGALSRMASRRSWLAVGAVVLVLICLLPPAGIYARRYVFAESLQFVLFAVAVPALLVLGAPWRMLGFSRPARDGLGARRRGQAGREGRAGQAAGAGREGRVGQAGRGGSGFPRGVTVLLAFMGMLIAWRLPVCVNALATLPGLAVLEMVTLVGAGSALWLELVESPPLLPRLSRPLRAVFAALAMWTIWILAYILGFSQVTFFTAYSHAGLSSVADQEIATGIMWAVPALCFVPVVFVTALTWLRDTEDPDEGLRQLVRSERSPRSVRWPRPPRGWNTHST